MPTSDNFAPYDRGAKRRSPHNGGGWSLAQQAHLETPKSVERGPCCLILGSWSQNGRMVHICTVGRQCFTWSPDAFLGRMMLESTTLEGSMPVKDRVADFLHHCTRPSTATAGKRTKPEPHCSLSKPSLELGRYPSLLRSAEHAMPFFSEAQSSKLRSPRLRNSSYSLNSLKGDMGVSQNYGYLVGVPITRVIVFLGEYWGPLI